MKPRLDTPVLEGCGATSRQRRAHLGAALALAGLAFASTAQAQTYIYARTAGNDLRPCAAGKGLAVLVAVSGLRSARGNLFVRVYPAREQDWLKGKRYIMRIDAAPQEGTMQVCVPLPAPGNYAIVVQHDVNGNRETDFGTDGAGMSNNPAIKTFLGIPRPPAVENVRFAAEKGITRLAIRVHYRD